MSDLYGALPAFADGQVLSASAHLNALQRFITLAHDDISGISAAVSGSAMAAIRHQWNTLQYRLIRRAGTVTIKYGATTVKTFSTGPTNVEITGTADLTSFAFTVNNFYELTVEGDCTTIFLREIHTSAWTTLASFASETVPTAAQWQALSDLAGEIAAVLDVPQALAERAREDVLLAHHDPYLWKYSLVHRGRYLHWDFKAQDSYYESDCPEPHDPHYVRIRLLANGVQVYNAEWNRFYWRRSGDVDLTTFPSAGLVIGESYTLTLEVSYAEACDAQDAGQFEAWALYEYPDDADGIAAWTPFKEWSHGNFVWGSTNPIANAKRIKIIKDDLEAMATTIEEVCYASPKLSRDRLLGVRRRRFLFYKTADDKSCTINWSYRGEDQQVTLPESSTAFLGVDLDGLEGLYPSTPYWIGEGALYAIEDSHA